MDGVNFEKNLGETCHKVITHVNKNIQKLEKKPKMEEFNHYFCMWINYIKKF